MLASSLKEADAIADRVSKLPEVGSVVTLEFHPDRQQAEACDDRKRGGNVGQRFRCEEYGAPADRMRRMSTALNEGAGQLAKIAGDRAGPGPDAAKRLSAALSALAKSNPEVRGKGRRRLLSRRSGRHWAAFRPRFSHTLSHWTFTARVAPRLDDTRRAGARVHRAEG